MTRIELTPSSFVVLGLLDGAGEATPYELKGLAAERLGDFWPLAHSQLYTEPERLTRAGYLTERREHAGRRRKRYALTDSGRRALAAWLEDPHTDRYELRDPGLLKLALGADPDRLTPAQLELHRHALARYEQIAAAIPADAPRDGRTLALHAGIGHEREYVRFWSALAETATTADQQGRQSS
jgi:DNA-binding PadR family transcriptional regulator